MAARERRFLQRALPTRVLVVVVPTAVVAAILITGHQVQVRTVLL